MDLTQVFLPGGAVFLCWNGWIVGSVKGGMPGVMGRDWRGRGVYWQIIGKMLASFGLAACCGNNMANCAKSIGTGLGVRCLCPDSGIDKIVSASWAV